MKKGGRGFFQALNAEKNEILQHIRISSFFEKSYLLKFYPMGALEFKYPLFRAKTKKSEVLIPIAQIVYSSASSSHNHVTKATRPFLLCFL